MKRFLRWVVGLASLGVLVSVPALALAANLLANGNLEMFTPVPDPPSDGSSEKVGTGWTHFYISSGTRSSKLHWFSSQDFATTFGGLNYRLEGNYAQNMWSSYKFDAGIYQRVTGLTPGTVYAFDVPVVTFWRGPGYHDSDGIMNKWVGIDPTGGTDASSPSVLWSEGDSDDKKWVYMELSARAEGEAMTFFVRVQAPENDSYNHTDLDMVYIDAAKVDVAPTVDLNVPAISDADVEFSWVATAAPGWSVKGVEVQVWDPLSQTWDVVQGKTGSGNSDYSFFGQPGYTYVVRARPWQTMAESYNSDIDMPGLWVEKSVVVGGAFHGHVRNNFGAGVGGAVVSTTNRSTFSGAGGFYALTPATFGQPYTLTASASQYKSPPPISGIVADAQSVTPITFTLKPANDAIANGDFESDFAGWNPSPAANASVFSGAHRSGAASLNLTGPVFMTQAVTISDAYNPTLSFWYNPALSGDDSFQVSLHGGALLATETFTAAATPVWRHAWLSLNQPQPLTGTLTVAFQLTGGQASLDEVSLGDGPYVTFLPVIVRSGVQ